MELILNSPKYGDHIVTFDDSDAQLVMAHKWFIAYHNDNVYAVATIYREINGEMIRRMIKMHQLIMGFPGKKIDHIDNNGINNIKSNLRIATTSQNAMNKKVPVGNKLGFKGVWWDKYRKKYKAALKINNKSITGGFFENPIHAAEKYNAMAVQYFGEFARLNTITEDDIKKHDVQYRRPLPSDNTTGYRGVYKSRDSKYKASIRLNRKTVYLGEFQTKEEAALAYNKSLLENGLAKEKLNNI